MTINHGNLQIKVVDIHILEADTIDNNYQFQYIYGNSGYNTSCKHGIRISEKGIEIASVIIFGYGGATGIHQNSLLISGSSIVICCGDQVYSLNLPSLELNWHKKCDLATCFEIYPYEDDFIIHGEVEITRIDLNGFIKWQFSGRDIFVTMDSQKEFEIIGKTIKLIDFNGYKYLLNGDGEETE